MIKIERDMRSMRYIIIIDRDEVVLGAMNQNSYNKLICRISKCIYEEIKRSAL